MLQDSKIKFEIDRSNIEGVKDMNNEVFPSHFLALICGKPGSGKTSLLKFILKNPQLLYKKYDFVFIISPSYKEYQDLYLPKINFINELDFDWVKYKINYINTKYPTEYINVLFILDDVISTLHKNSRSKEILDFIFNRRHLLNNGMISIILTSQKYNCVPTPIRSNITMFITFKLNNIDWKHIKDEIIFSDLNFDDILNYTFTDDKQFLIYRLDNNQFYKNFDKFNI